MSKKLTLQDFIYKANIKHNNLYTYKNSNYINSKENIIITCPIHGDFEQNSSNHLSGAGCNKCGVISRINLRRSKLEDFIKKSLILYKDKNYDYSLVSYIHSKEKVEIICPLHGNFWVIPNEHLNKIRCGGCKQCGIDSKIEKCKEHAPGWNLTNWIKAGEKSKNFDSFKVYIIKCWNKNEEFYKIGRTYLKIKNRFFCKQLMPYEYSIIKIYQGEAKKIFELENNLKRNNKEYSYIPKIKFNGMYECFSKIKEIIYC